MERSTVVYNPALSGKEFVLEFRNSRDFPQAIALMEKDERLRNEIFEAVLEKEYPLPEYSAWLAGHFFMKNKKLLTDYWCNFFVDELLRTENHTTQRNISMILNHFKGDLSERSDLLDKLFEFLTHPDSLPALRIHALRNIEIHYLKKYPELLNELFSAMEMLQEQTLPSVKAMIRNFNKKYRK